MVRDSRLSSDRWVEDVVVATLGPLTNKVQIGDVLWKRHINQLKRRCEVDKSYPDLVSNSPPRQIPIPLSEEPHDITHILPTSQPLPSPTPEVRTSTETPKGQENIDLPPPVPRRSQRKPKPRKLLDL